MEGLLLDGLLDTVLKQDVYIALRSDLKDDPNRLGTGTAADPFDGSTTSGGVYKFDLVMKRIMDNLLTNAMVCIHLGPSFVDPLSTVKTFQTQGDVAYKVKSLVRITGSGRDVTKVQLVGSGHYVFSNAGATTPTGIEIDNICIDVGRQGGALDLTGTNIVGRNLRITNFGPSSAINQVVVKLANSSAGNIARNCVLQDCAFEAAGDYAVGSTVTFVQLIGSVDRIFNPPVFYPHNFCAVRGCVFDARKVITTNPDPTAWPVTGIDVGIGRGFIAEENHFFNVKVGIQLNDPAIDAILWNNQMEVVRTGFSLNNTYEPVGRVAMIENTINLARDTPGPGTTSTGISIVGNGAGARNYTTIIARKNVIAGDPDVSNGGNTLVGISVGNVTNAVVENNLINGCTEGNSVSYSECTTFKSFNNQTTDGKLLRGFSSSGMKMELQDLLEDAVIGI